MTVSANTLFRNPHVDVPDVIKNVFQIFGSQWQVYLLLTLAQVGVGILLGLCYRLLLYSALFQAVMNNVDADRSIRFLVEHVVGSSGGGSTTRLLEDSYSYYDYSYNYNYNDGSENYYGFNPEDLTKIFDALSEAIGVLITFCLITILFIFALVMISSTFSGAMIRVTSEVYAGSSATFRQALEHGWKKCFNILGFRFLYGIGLVAITIVVFILPLMATIDLESDDLESDDLAKIIDDLANIISLMFLLYLVLLVIYTIISCALIAGEPSIIVEKTSIIGSFKRSWGLCKSKICLIFCSVFSLKFVEFIIYLIASKIAGNFGFVTLLIMGPFYAIMATVLYITLRMQSEELTQNDLAQELSITHPQSDFVPVSAEPIDEAPLSKDEFVKAQVV